ncbi:G-type lectin S-receptor-like serine/threonine-protein kinase [Morus notabilis]|uniref:Receptor-like serine/threonine-protein kinase n=1 Tax=Morus notabilis TaxID=981085 RepID=W9S4J8_9ROSA|nr:G-type lectin S-receptor-like serine/threonine-protein kinase At4g27290 [Morus notabilis]XP_024028003.1 G-type lectin S-receptor-like serine/threonine-protein kinase At4g27290 [Morus notabilis]EXC10167.1 G-type lectin S-receptor-like serine/threonine-protein kinase [Morus notabilis]
MASFGNFVIAVMFLLLSHTVSDAIDSVDSSQSIRDGTTLVSKQGSFEFGFFTPGNSNNRYVGIWYKKISVQTVVWVANRCNPINDSSGSLSINSTGNLVLLYQNKTVVWSTNSSKQARKPIVELLDSGNLVLRDDEDRNAENYLWQSFDYPSDTILPNMKFGLDLRTGLKRHLSAWKSWDDPCPADFTLTTEYDPQLHTFPDGYIWKGSAKFFRTGPWNGLRLSGSPELRSNPLYNFTVVQNDNEVYFIYNLKNESVITRVTLNYTTRRRERLTWIEAEQTWRLYSSLPKDDCDSYGVCGAHGNCMIDESPICQCLRRFKPTSQEKWNSMDWSDGCVRNNPLNCTEKNRDGFVKYSDLKVPDTTHSWVNKSMNLEECRAKCLSNCSCTAYTNYDIRGQGSGCAIWFGDLMDIRQFSSGGQDLFIRMSHSELDKGSADYKRRASVIVVAVIGGVSGMLLLVYCIRRRRSKDRNQTMSQNGDGDRDGDADEDLELPLFKLSSITAATDAFALYNKLGEGGFGPVYRGKLEDGQEIAVKRLSIRSAQGVTELRNEVKLIAKLQHRNLVKLLGCCIQGEEKLLVYEYMPNKSLDSFIFDQKQGKLLEWPKRFQIICGVARGLLYLHQDSRLRVIHRDLKASNVLLDNDMNPKISDFGLARTFGADQTEEKTNRVIGTYGYMAPEYAFDGLFSIKSDVFSFGILVLEIVSGKKSRGFHHQNNGLTLIGHVWKLHREGNSIEMLDKSLRVADHNLKQVLRCIHVGLLCVQQSPVDRPNISTVVAMLGSESELPQPKLPGYFTEMDAVKGDSSSTKPDLSSTNDMSITLLEAR